MISYRAPADGEESAMSELVLAAFRTHIAPGMSERGVEEFAAYAHPNSIRARRLGAPPHFQLVAVRDARPSADDSPGAAAPRSAPELVGVAEIRNWQHVSMLYVHPDRHRLGIGRGLVDRLLRRAAVERPQGDTITVYSSLFAVPIYERYGFEITGDARDERGILHVPMALRREP